MEIAVGRMEGGVWKPATFRRIQLWAKSRPTVFRSLVFNPARAVAHIAFAIARIAACFADTAFCSFNMNVLLSHSYHRQQHNCFRLLFLDLHQFQ
jgi:hypothetical protein